MNGRFSPRSAWPAHLGAIASASNSTHRRMTMTISFKAAAASAVIGITALASLPASAEEGFALRFGNGAVTLDRSEPVQYRSDHRWPDDGWGHRPDDRWDRRPDDRWDRRAEWGRGCTPGRALDKAERMGIWRARIAEASPRTITVTGRSRGERVFVTFARAPRCPVIG
jgi:hypothetical protein